jgi:Na+/phosphate symporter
VKDFTTKEIDVLLKWKKVKSTSKRKADLIQAYVDAPKPKIQKTWVRSEEAALAKLKEEVVELKETAVGVAASQMAKAVTTNLNHLDEESIAALKKAIDGLDSKVQESIL